MTNYPLFNVVCLVKCLIPISITDYRLNDEVYRALKAHPNASTWLLRLKKGYEKIQSKKYCLVEQGLQELKLKERKNFYLSRDGNNSYGGSRVL